MYKKIALLFLSLFLGLPALAQNNINDYKYVVVPIQFDFLKEKDKYRTSTLTRYLFKKEGFEVYFDKEELPADLFQNRCLALYVNIQKLKAFLSTKVQIEMKDCRGNLIFKSEEGSSKIKEYAKAYPEAIRKAFGSIEVLNYKYNQNSNVGVEQQTIAKTKPIDNNTEEEQKAKVEVQRLKKEVQDLKKQKELAEAKSKLDKEKAEKVRVVEAKSKLGSKAEEKSEPVRKISLDLLYAQPIDKGFQLVDASPKVVMILLKTAAPNVYTVKGKPGIVFKEGKKWYYSENDSKKELNIKF